MNIYTVNQITEPDFGCEENGHNEQMALVKLTSEDDTRYVEIPERVLEKQGIREGKKVIITKDGSLLKYIRVVAAVIEDNKDGKKKIFATARGYGDYKGWWEFPGGKIEDGETPQEALVREIREELTATIKVKDLIQTVEYDYPDFHLSMDCFWAETIEGSLVLKEAEASRWLSLDELDTVKWLPADKSVLLILSRRML